MFNIDTLLVRQKVLFSLYHEKDEQFRKQLGENFIYMAANIPPADTDCDPDDPDGYIRALRDEKIVTDESVVVVLAGPETADRKHVDWEIYAALGGGPDAPAGLVGILLPDFPTYEFGSYRTSDLPARLADNVNSGYAEIYTWDHARAHMPEIIKEASESRIIRKEKIDNSREIMRRNL